MDGFSANGRQEADRSRLILRLMLPAGSTEMDETFKTGGRAGSMLGPAGASPSHNEPKQTA